MMGKIIKNWISDFYSLNSQCKKFLYLYLVRAISAGTIFYISIYLAHMSLKASIIGYEISAIVSGNLLGALVALRILNSSNAFKLSGLSIIAQGIAFFCIPFVKNTNILAFSVFFIGLFGYIYNVSSIYLITSLSGDSREDRSKAITFTTVFSNLGLGIGGATVSIFTYYNPVLLFVIIGFSLLFASIPYFRNSQKLKKIIDNNDNRNEKPNKNYLIVGLAAIFIVGVIYAQLRIGLGIFFENNLSSVDMSTVIFLNMVLIITALPVLRPFIIKFSYIRVLGVGMLLLGAGIFGLKFMHQFKLVLLLCATWTIGEMIAATISQLICFQSSDKDKRGKVMGGYKFLYALGGVAGAVVGTTILEYYSLDHLWVMCGALGMLAFVLAMIINPSKTKANSHQALRNP